MQLLHPLQLSSVCILCCRLHVLKRCCIVIFFCSCGSLCHCAGEPSQTQSVIHQLHRLGFLKQNPAHKTYQVEPYLGPHLAALAQQQPSALYSPSLLGWSQACLQTCARATALYSAHAQVTPVLLLMNEYVGCCCAGLLQNSVVRVSFWTLAKFNKWFPT